MTRKIDEISILIGHDVAFLRAIDHQTILLIPVLSRNCQVESGRPPPTGAATMEEVERGP
jgi:hypothetical protein